MSDNKVKKVNQKPTVPEYKTGHQTFEQYQEFVNTETGEVVTSCRGIVKRQDKEPDYVKLYLNTMLSFSGINNVSVEFLVCLCNHLDNRYINDEKKPLVFKNDAYNKDEMAKELGIGVPMVKKHIKKLVDAGVLIKTNRRSVYFVNPYLLARGQWQNIKSLQMHFELYSGEWRVDTVLNPEAPETEENKNA